MIEHQNEFGDKVQFNFTLELLLPKGHGKSGHYVFSVDEIKDGQKVNFEVLNISYVAGRADTVRAEFELR